MKFKTMKNGDQMPALGLGTWKMSDGSARDAVRSAIESGYRHIDCAWIYENESDVGQGLTDALQDNQVNRDDLWITSKLWNDRHRAEHVADALRESLKQLGVSYLDLYLIHWPVAHEYQVPRPESADQFRSLNDVPLEETWGAMLECVEQGLCRNAGVSNFSTRKLQHLIDTTGVSPACNQVEAHPYLQQNDLLRFCNDHQIVFTAYSPLGSGDRPDMMKRPDEPALFDNERICAIANSHDASVAQIMLAWAVQRGTVPIPKSTNADRQAQNLAAMEIELTNDEMQQLAELDLHHRYVDGTFWEVPGGPYTVGNLWDEADKG